eukprot:3032599-Pyramimonas_sp.AAC.1
MGADIKPTRSTLRYGNTKGLTSEGANESSAPGEKMNITAEVGKEVPPVGAKKGARRLPIALPMTDQTFSRQSQSQPGIGQSPQLELGPSLRSLAAT